MNRYIAFFFLITLSCTTPQRPISTPKNINSLTGKGSSFVLPMTSKLFPMFEKNYTIRINYETQNSYVGIDALITSEVDFALTSVPLTDQQYKDNPDILHIPIAAAGINFAYNIPGAEFSLNADPVYLTPEILAKILNHQITHWNDPEITDLNKKVAEDTTRVFPNLPISVIQRADISGDTYLLTSFLTKATSLWKNGQTNKLPSGNKEGATALDLMKTLVQTPGGLTYTTMIYGIQNNIPLIRIRNHLGVYGRGCNFRTLEAMKVASTNTDNRVDLTYPQEGRESGVATGIMYILIKKEQNYNNKTKAQAQNLVDFIDWLLSPTAQRELEPLYFSGLTPKFRYAAHTMLSNAVYDGEQLVPTKK
ncbi:MAG: phosphate ABC transporter substrate-binding protein PstS [Brevinema sp.]